MKKFFVKIKNNILITTIIIDIIIILFGIIVSLFGLTYRQWVLYFTIIITILGTILGIIQKLKDRSNLLKVLIYCVFLVLTVLIIIASPIILFLAGVKYYPEYIVEKDNKRYVAYVNSSFEVNVDYYDYVNFLLMGNKVKMHECYRNGGYNPFADIQDSYFKLSCFW